MKKAVLFTLSALTLVLVIFALSIVIYHNAQRSEERVFELGSLDRIFDLFSSVEKSIIELFNTYGEINVTISKNPDGTTDISFKEDISRVKEDWGEDFNERMEDFVSYVESKESYIKVYSEKLEDKELPILIKPHNIQYGHSWETGQVKINVVPLTSADNFNSYDVLINTNDVEIDKVQSQIGKLDSFNFRVKAVDNFGNSFTEERSVDPESQHQVKVFLIGGNIVKITLKDKELEIWTNEDDTMTITTTIDELEKTDEEITAEFLGITVYVNIPELGVSKNSTIKLL